ncbi:hypothetical protein MNBD_PLANCTO03-295 [hydrothermal vent metagenome]|uniref:Uncharacterized protein n=1 Tax=hydrothermal vent metagenome TaxID=652676 RepID=A0A3B1E2R9_9ZZZZ
MPKLRLFHGIDPLESDAIPFPRARQLGERFELHLADSVSSIRQVEEALDQVQHRLDNAQALLTGTWFDDDGPRAA